MVPQKKGDVQPRMPRTKHTSATNFAWGFFNIYTFNKQGSIIKKGVPDAVASYFSPICRDSASLPFWKLQAERSRWLGRWHLKQQEPSGSYSIFIGKAWSYPKPSHNFTTSSLLWFNQINHMLDIVTEMGLTFLVFPSFQLQASGLHVKDTIII